MICKEANVDVTAQQQQQQQNQHSQQQPNGFNTLQHRRKSQLITFSASSSDIKHNLSGHEVTLFNAGGMRHSIVSNASSNGGMLNNGRLSFAEEDIMLHNQSNGVVGTSNIELEDEVFRRHSLEADQGVEGDEDMDEELFDDELLYCGTHISASHNANDDSGGGSGSYEDSHALHSSIGGSNRNSLEKDDDDVDVISTDVSCYEQLVGSAGTNIAPMTTRHDDSGGDTSAHYAKLKLGLNGSDGTGCVGVGGSAKGGDCAGTIYANPFMGL